MNLPRNLADDLQDDVQIQPGDTHHGAPHRAPIIYVVGDAGRPAGLLVDNGSLTVLQALAPWRGGRIVPRKWAQCGSFARVRTGMVETKVPLKKMLEAKTPGHKPASRRHSFRAAERSAGCCGKRALARFLRLRPDWRLIAAH